MTVSMESSGTTYDDRVSPVTNMLLGFISTGEFPPGFQIRQEAVSKRCGVGRWALREALQSLETQGAVERIPNVGYFVARLDRDQLLQLYRMRQLLESELLLSIPKCDEPEITALRSLNKEITREADIGNIVAMQRLNVEFHRSMFGLSPLTMFAETVGNLWNRSHAYRSIYLLDGSIRLRVVEEHDAMIEALLTDDRKRLVKIADQHRTRSAEMVAAMLPGP